MFRSKILKTAAVTIVSMAIAMAFMSGSAFAFGQCGPGTTNPAAWVQQIQAMGVTTQTEQLEAAAGFHRMDGSFPSWVNARVVAAPLVEPADPIDFGCHYGDLYSVGSVDHALPKGTVVLVALPNKYDKSDVSTTSHPGWPKVEVTVAIVAKTNCANPEKGPVVIFLWIRPQKSVPSPKPKPTPKPKKALVRIYKIAENASKHGIPMPTGIFRVRVTINGKSHIVKLVSDPQPVGSYKIGTKVSMKELKPLGKEQWTLVNANQPPQIVRAGGNTFTFKNIEKAAKPAPVQKCTNTHATNFGQAGDCVFQSNSCPANQKWDDVQNQCVNANCSNVNASGSNVNQGGNCNCVGTNVCNTTTTTPTPTPTPSAPTASVGYIQEFDASNGVITYTGPVCGSFTAKAGDILNVTFSVNYGNWGTPVQQLTYSNVMATGSSQTLCPTYYSPTEFGVQDQVTMTVMDTTTGLSFTAQSNLFDIVAPASNPGAVPLTRSNSFGQPRMVASMKQPLLL